MCQFKCGDRAHAVTEKSKWLIQVGMNDLSNLVDEWSKSRKGLSLGMWTKSSRSLGDADFYLGGKLFMPPPKGKGSSASVREAKHRQTRRGIWRRKRQPGIYGLIIHAIGKC